MRRINIRSFIGSKTAGNIVIVIGVIFFNILTCFNIFHQAFLLIQ